MCRRAAWHVQVLESPYRSTTAALLRYVDYLATRWWHPFVRNYPAWRLKWTLLFRPRIPVLSVPLYLND